MTGPTVKTDTVTARSAPKMRTRAEMRGSEDTPGRVPACLLDVVLPTLVSGSTVLLAGPHQDAVAVRLAHAGFQVTMQLRGIADAEAASRRLPSSVDVRCGTLIGTGDTFDAVVALGGLAFLSTGDAPLRDWGEALDLLRSLVAPSGVLAVVVRNGLGLDRLTRSGSDVDFHRADAYMAQRRAVADRLPGFAVAEEFGLYPEAAAPEIAVPAGAYGRDAAMVTTLVSDGYRAAITDRHTLSEPRRLARESVAYGLGLDLAPGWLIIGKSGPDAQRELPLAALVTDARRDDFKSVPCLLSASLDGSWYRSRVSGGDMESETHGNVSRDASALDGPVARGHLLEEILINAAGAHDVATVRELVGRYAAWLGVGGGLVECPPDRSFAMADNVVDDGSELRAFDPSWRAVAPTSADVVFVAAMHRFAQRLLAAALPHPWPSGQTPAKLAARLASMATLDVSTEQLEAGAEYAGLAASVLDGRGIDEIERIVVPVIPRGETEPAVIVRPAEPVRPITRPAGLAEAIRTIDAISDEMAATHEQIALLAGIVADLDSRLAKSRHELARLKASRLYQLVRWIATPLRVMRRWKRR